MKEKAKKAFSDYAAKYDAKDEKVRLKIEHTYRVSALCERIARACGLSEKDVLLAWLCGLLHDVGRFEQLKQFGTFNDAISVDHALLGAKILFDEGKIRDYIEDSSNDEFIREVISCHSAYRIPEEYNDRTRLFANILRDADKIDIFRVNVDFPLEEIYNVSTEILRSEEVTPEVFDAFMAHHAVLRSLKKTAVDNVVGHISLVYELVFPISIQIVADQGYLNQLLNFQSQNPQTVQKFNMIRQEISAFLSNRKF